jgi:hypothetical protein
VRNTPGRRAPLHVNDLRALAHKVDRKHLKSDIDDARWCGKQVVRFCVVPSFHDRFVVLNPGLPINTASDRVLRASRDRRLRPKITWSGDRIPSAEELDKMHHSAHENCFIANSVKTDVTVAKP